MGPGVGEFPDLVMRQAANDIVLNIRVGRSNNPADAVLEIIAAVTSPFKNLANSLDNLNILQAPKTETCVTANR